MIEIFLGAMVLYLFVSLYLDYKIKKERENLKIHFKKIKIKD